MHSTRRVRYLAAMMLCGVVLFTAGCTSYYAVTDLKRDKTYYTTEVHRASGTVRFVDAKNGGTVTIQESEIREISEKEFKAAGGKD